MTLQYPTIHEVSRIKSLPRTLLRLAWGAAAFSAILFAALVLWLRYDALPHADRYREVIVASLEKASGMAVSVRSIRGGWGGLRPVLSLEGLAIGDRRGQVAFELAHAEVSLAWWSLFRGELRFVDVDLYRPFLELRRGADGLIYLADKPLNEAGAEGDGAILRWLLEQPRVGIHDASLVWRDDFLGTPAVRLTAVEIAVERRGGRHHAAIAARPPRDLAARVEARGDVALAWRDGRWQARGTLYAEARDADFGNLRAYLPAPEAVRNGLGHVRVWGTFSPERGIEEVVADLNLREARARLAADALPLELASLAGRATYRVNDDGGFTFATEGLRFRLASGLEAEPGRFTIARGGAAAPRFEVRADNIDLKIAAALIEFFPVPRELKVQVLRYAPRGRIREAMLAWTEGTPRSWAVKGRFEDLSVNAVDKLPGFEGFDGAVEGDAQGGTLVLDTRDASLELATLYSEPLRFTKLAMRARWKPDGEALQVAVEEAAFSNADAEGVLTGTWRSLPQSPRASPGMIDVRGTLSRADATKVARYLPERFEVVRGWLQRAVVAGQSARASFEVRGDLYDFPFGPEVQGRFLVEGDVKGGRLRYHPDWPSVDAIDGSFRFENRRMEIRAERAAIFDSRVRTARAVIEDLRARPLPLVVEGEVDTAGADAMRFLRESPLVNGPGAFTRAVAVEGPGRLALRLDFPIGSPEGVKVAGEYAFAGATATAARGLAMRDVQGKLAFSERGVRAPDIAGTLFGRPAKLAMSTQEDGRVLTVLEGRVAAPVLAEWIPEVFAARIAGETDWKARVLTGAGGVDLTLESDLRGIAATLPEPFAKRAEDARAMTLAITRLGAENETTRVALAGGVHGRFARVGERWQAALRFGEPPAAEPARDGLWLYGALASLDVDAWQALFSAAKEQAAQAPAAAAGPGVELRGVDLKLGRVRYSGREFRELAARLERRGAQWAGRLESPVVAGEVTWSPGGRGRVEARLQRLAIPEPVPGAAPATPGDAGELPALDVVAERFDFRGRALGRLELKAEPAGEEWRIERLDLAASHSTMRSSGVSRRTAVGPITTLQLKVEVGDMHGLFATFGYGEYLKRGKGEVQASLAWPGLAHEFSVGNLSGTMRVEARDGQFAKIEPGAGKLLGLLSLQSLPRRVAFDFRDVFSDGFAFERIQGEVRVARGVLLADEFEISGPSAFVSLAGEVSLPQETQALTLRVVPEVGEGMALAATVLGTPVLGLSTLLVSKLLKNPLGKVVAYEYHVSGSWDNPQVTRTSAAPPRAAAAAQAATPNP